MKISMQRFLLLLSLLSCNISNLFSSNAIIQRRDGSHDICDPKSCLQDHIGWDQEYMIDFTVVINRSDVETSCEFPWKIKAFDADGRFVGESEEILMEDFYNVPSSLKEAGVRVLLPQVSLLRSPHSDCYQNSCGDNYILVELIFKLYSGLEEVEYSCPLFDNPALTPYSHEIEESVVVCNCPIFESESDTIVSEPPVHYWYYGSASTPVIPQNISSMSKVDTIESSSSISIKEIDRVETTKIQILQNPIKNHLKIKFSKENTKNFSIDIFSLTGSRMLKQFISSPEKQELYLDISKIPSGTYFVRFKSNNVVYTKKILKI